MKTAKDPRHLRRIKIMQQLYAQQFSKGKPDDEAVKQITSNKKKVDSAIKKAAPSWPINQINKIDLAILRLAVFELIIVKDAPIKVIIDEAIELAKEYGSEASPGFVNGVLGKIVETTT